MLSFKSNKYPDTYPNLRHLFYIRIREHSIFIMSKNMLIIFSKSNFIRSISLEPSAWRHLPWLPSPHVLRPHVSRRQVTRRLAAPTSTEDPNRFPTARGCARHGLTRGIRGARARTPTIPPPGGP
jgi:hypothetical protein